MTTRRQFVLTTLPAAGFLLAAAERTFAQAVHIEETDPVAVSLGYRNDATKVDSKKFPAYVAGRHCASCQLFQGAATDAWAACAVMGGKQVNAKGWCSAWVQKA
jgi:hypothetical protein